MTYNVFGETLNLTQPTTHSFKKGDFQSVFGRSSLAVTPSKKSSVITNRKSTIGFPLSLR